MKLLRLFTLCLLFLAVMPASLRAQQRGADLIREIQGAYRLLDFEGAERLAQGALDAYESFTPEQLTELHTVLGLINYAQNELDEARQQFQLALSLRPDLQLDPLLVSPKILAFFEEVRQEAQIAGLPGGTAPTIRYVLLEDPRAAAAWRSALLPGWGQLYKGEAVKGHLLVGLWAATALGGAAAHLIMRDRHQAYLDVPGGADDSEFDAAYDAYNTWRKVRNNLLLGAGGIWVYSHFDALLAGRPTRAFSRYSLAVSPLPYPAAPQVHFRLRF